MAGRRSRGSGWTVPHRPTVRGRRVGTAYADVSMRPLHVLIFLLPLIVLYEVGASLYLSDPAHGVSETIRAHSILLGFFQDFGVVGRFVPALTLVVVLLVWHVLRDDPWSVRPAVLGGMAVESVAWTIPLVVLVAIVLSLGGAAVPAVAAGAGALLGLSPQAGVTISVGAGLYEELLFRMIGMAAVHTVLVDLARMTERWGVGLSIAATAAAFAVYHDGRGAGGELETLKALSLLCAGAYFGLVYWMRGFGVVVAVHALYDVFALVLLPALDG